MPQNSPHSLDLIRPVCELPAEPSPPLTLEVGCEYETEDGRVFTVDAMRPDGEMYMGWQPGGSTGGYVVVWYRDGRHCNLHPNLCLVRKHELKPKTVEFWVNEHPGGEVYVSLTKEEADARRNTDRIGRHHVVIESGRWDE